MRVDIHSTLQVAHQGWNGMRTMIWHKDNADENQDITSYETAKASPLPGWPVTLRASKCCRLLRPRLAYPEDRTPTFSLTCLAVAYHYPAVAIDIHRLLSTRTWVDKIPLNEQEGQQGIPSLSRVSWLSVLSASPPRCRPRSWIASDRLATALPLNATHRHLTAGMQ
jgi:hypothetical protein